MRNCRIEVDVGRGRVPAPRDGRRIIDLYGGHAVAALGYAHPALLAALEAAGENMYFQSNAVALDVRARAATRLVAFARPGLDTRVLRQQRRRGQRERAALACRITGRAQVVAIEHSFHGRTAAAAAVTWGAAKKWYGFPRAPFDVEFIPRGDHGADGRALIDDETAAVIIEPVQGVAGAFDLGSRVSRGASRALQRDMARC